MNWGKLFKKYVEDVDFAIIFFLMLVIAACGLLGLFLLIPFVSILFKL